MDDYTVRIVFVNGWGSDLKEATTVTSYPFPHSLKQGLESAFGVCTGGPCGAARL